MGSGAGADKKAGSGEVRCVAGTAPALLQSSVRGQFIRRIISQWNSANYSFRVFFSGERFVLHDKQV